MLDDAPPPTRGIKRELCNSIFKYNAKRGAYYYS